MATLVSHLSVAMRGLDFSTSRPNAVLLLMGAAVANGKQLSEVLATSLFGLADRVVVIDFARMTQSYDVTMLIGAPPGYVGYSDTLPIHRLSQMPWCVLICENVQAAHPTIVDILVQALATGVIADAQGKRIYLRDALVVLTAPIDVANTEGGIGPSLQEAAVATSTSIDAFKLAEGALGSSLVAQCDVVCYRSPDGAESLRTWIKQRLLVDLTERYRKNGVHIQWDDNIVEWLLSGPD